MELALSVIGRMASRPMCVWPAEFLGWDCRRAGGPGLRKFLVHCYLDRRAMAEVP